MLAPILPKLTLNNKFSSEFIDTDQVDSDFKGKVVPPELITIQQISNDQKPDFNQNKCDIKNQKFNGT